MTRSEAETLFREILELDLPTYAGRISDLVSFVEDEAPEDQSFSDEEYHAICEVLHGLKAVEWGTETFFRSRDAQRYVVVSPDEDPRFAPFTGESPEGDDNDR